MVAVLNSRRPGEYREAGKATIDLSAASSYYDSASNTGERDYGYHGGAVYEDYHFTTAVRSVTIARLRREIRNNPYLAGLVNKFPEAIGYSNLRSRTSSREYNDAKDLFWFRYSKQVTTSGESLRELEDIIKSELLVAGEVFLVYMQNGRVQMIPSEFCGSPLGDGLSNEINGVVYNDYGKPVRYRFGRMSPFGTIEFSESSSTLVDARYVRHIYKKDRVLMGRGLPWLLPSLQAARDLYEITRAKTKQIKDVSSITGAIETESPKQFMGTLPGLDPETLDPIIEDGDADADAKEVEPRKIELKPNQLAILKMGEKLNLFATKYEAQDYKELIMLMLHAISSPIGLPVELWFSGLGDVNYSGFKGLGTQWNARRQNVLTFLETRFLDPLHFWRISKAHKEGDLVENPDGDEDLIEWSWRRTAVLDDEKHAKAVEIRTRTGEKSIADFWEEDGYFTEEVFAKRRELWIKANIAAGLISPDDDLDAVEVPLSFLFNPTFKESPAPAGRSEEVDTSDPEKVDDQKKKDKTDGEED